MENEYVTTIVIDADSASGATRELEIDEEKGAQTNNQNSVGDTEYAGVHTWVS